MSFSFFPTLDFLFNFNIPLSSDLLIILVMGHTIRYYDKCNMYFQGTSEKFSSWLDRPHKLHTRQ